MHMMRSKMLLPGAKCILMDTDLAYEIGKSAALFLQQVHYWLSNEKITGKSHDNKKWIANSYEEWSHDIKMMSESTIKRAAKKLEKLGLIQIAQLFKKRGNRTNCITINYDQLNTLLLNTKKTGSSEEASNESSPHQVKLIPSSDQNDLFLSKNTNKDLSINKSEERLKKTVRNAAVNQVPQVDKKNNIPEENTGTRSKGRTQSTIVQEMVSIWNATFSKNQAKLTKELARKLNYAFQHKFDFDMMLWKNYCLMIESSTYLTGNSFSLHLDWAIKFKTMDDMEAGRYGGKNLMKEIKEKQEKEDLRQELLNEIEILEESEECKNLRRKLLDNGVLNYDRLLRNTPIYKDQGFFFFIAENPRKEDEIMRVYPIHFHRGGSLETYENLKNSESQLTPSLPSSDLDFELMLIDTSQESKVIKEQRRKLCLNFGIEMYKEHFRYLNLVERAGEVLIPSITGKMVTLSEKMSEVFQDV